MLTAPIVQLRAHHAVPRQPRVAFPLSTGSALPLQRVARAKGRRQLTTCAVSTGQLIGLGLFFTPGLAALGYAYYKGRGNLKDGLSRLLTEVSQGYFQPNVGGENIPVATGELSDLAGDEPLFKALYNWCAGNENVHKRATGRSAVLLQWNASSSGAFWAWCSRAACAAAVCPCLFPQRGNCQFTPVSTSAAAGSLRVGACSSLSLVPRPSLSCLTRWLPVTFSR
jgi:hypothetical protein